MGYFRVNKGHEIQKNMDIKRKCEMILDNHYKILQNKLRPVSTAFGSFIDTEAYSIWDKNGSNDVEKFSFIDYLSKAAMIEDEHNFKNNMRKFKDLDDTFFNQFNEQFAKNNIFYKRHDVVSRAIVTLNDLTVVPVGLNVNSDLNDWELINILENEFHAHIIEIQFSGISRKELDERELIALKLRAHLLWIIGDDLEKKEHWTKQDIFDYQYFWHFVERNRGRVISESEFNNIYKRWMDTNHDINWLRSWHDVK